MFFSRLRKKNQPAVLDEKNSLASLLLQMKIITQEQLEEALSHKAVHDDMMLGSTLRSLGFCTSEDLSKALTIQSKILDGDRANVALDLMEARIERFRQNEEQLEQEIAKKKSRRERAPESCVVLALSPADVKVG